MKNIYQKIAAALAFIIGGMAVLSGVQVLLGNQPDYYVINWLPVYNYTIGILTIFVTAILIWVNSKLAWIAAIGTTSLHTIVMSILQTAYAGVVAPESIRAMTIRMVTWAIILVLMFIQSRQSKTVQVSPVPA